MTKPLSHSKGKTGTNALAYRCIHTCECLGKSGDERKDVKTIIFPRWSNYRGHVSAHGRHPNCPGSCPGHRLINNPGNLTPDDLKANSITEYVYKCAHTCPCKALGRTVSDPDSWMFVAKDSAQKHMADVATHPRCTSSCPAFNGLGKMGQVEALLVPMNDDDAVVGEVYSSQTAPNQKRHGTWHDEESTSIASNVKKSRLDPSNIPIPCQSQSTSLDLIRPPESQTRAIPAYISNEIPTLSSSTRPYNMTSSSLIRTVDYELTGAELIMQYLSALNELCKRLSQTSPELHALSMGLYMLPHVNSRNAHFAISGSPTVQSAPDIPAAFVSIINTVMDTVRGASEALGELLQVKDQDGLLDMQDPDIRELRRKVARLYDQIVDLRLDLHKVGMKNGVEGLVQEKRRVKEAILKVSTELDDIGGKMKELMVEGLNQLPLL